MFCFRHTVDTSSNTAWDDFDFQTAIAASDDSPIRRGRGGRGSRGSRGSRGGRGRGRGRGSRGGRSGSGTLLEVKLPPLGSNRRGSGTQKGTGQRRRRSRARGPNYYNRRHYNSKKNFSVSIFVSRDLGIFLFKGT